MILEGLVTTLDPDGAARIAPMGPIVDQELDHLVVRPFRTSRTYSNLIRTRQGVFHLTDDVELLAQAAIHRLHPLPAMMPAAAINGLVLCDACQWFAFRVITIDDSATRASMECQVVDRGRIRDFIGFNRARNAVVEASILATRVGMLDPSSLLDELNRLRTIVEKTAGQSERRAFECLESYIRESLSKRE